MLSDGGGAQRCLAVTVRCCQMVEEEPDFVLGEAEKEAKAAAARAAAAKEAEAALAQANAIQQLMQLIMIMNMICGMTGECHQATS